MASSSISYASTDNRINCGKNEFSISHPFSPGRNIEEKRDTLTNVDTLTLNIVMGKGDQKARYTFGLPW